MNWLDGQDRRRWLDDKSAGFENALRYYLGPTGVPDKAVALADLAHFLDAGDVYEAQAGAEDIRRAQNGWDTLAGGGRMLSGVSAALIPAVGAKAIRDTYEGGVDVLGSVVDDFMTGYDPNTVNTFTVWHGSPHKFDKFDMDRIGTGKPMAMRPPRLPDA